MTQKVGIYGIGISRHWQREPLLGFLGQSVFYRNWEALAGPLYLIPDQRSTSPFHNTKFSNN